MISFLKGAVASTAADSVVLDVGGVGYGVLMPPSSIAKLPGQGQEATVLTYLQLTDKGAALYGFLSAEEKALFERLIAVSGVGPKMALAALSAFSPEALVSAIAHEDVAMVAQIPGVGKKTASRIVLELKGSLEQGMGGLFGSEGSADAAAGHGSPALEGAIEALLSMGFTSAEADLALSGAPEGASEAKLLQYALKRLGGR